MTAHHTPAPWGEDDRKTVYIRQATFLATVHYEDAEADANTALIKAAPDLLAVAKLVAQWLAADSGNAPLQRAKYELAKSLARGAFGSELGAAIAKAEGR